MSSVDDLIDELFCGPAGDAPGTSAVAQLPQTKLKSTWDSSSDDGAPDAGKGAGNNRKGLTFVSELPAVKERNRGLSIANDFDDDSAEDGDSTGPRERGGTTGRPSIVQRVVFTVPFPPRGASNGTVTCSCRSFVTNLGTKARPHPSLTDLLAVADGRYDASSNMSKMMLRKGAFHVDYPALGNGSLDHHGDVTQPGGCPNMLCKKCNYAVIRLQGAEWCDQDPSVDLYLTTRNYYPDWSRLASSYPVGHADAKSCGLVLRSNDDAAAYCCQCSWLTVRGPREVLETKMTDHLAYVAKEGKHPFATEVPSRQGENRRPPLWVCSGHEVA